MKKPGSTRINHLWSAREGNIQTCIKCGCVREFINGFPVYKLDIKQTLSAPQCVLVHVLKIV